MVVSVGVVDDAVSLLSCTSYRYIIRARVGVVDHAVSLLSGT